MQTTQSLHYTVFINYIAKTFGILLWVTDLHVTMLSAYNNAELCLAVQKALIFLKEKSKVFQYAKWLSQWLTN